AFRTARRSMKSWQRWLLAVTAALIPSVVAVTVYVIVQRGGMHRESALPPKPEAPPDLEKLRPQFTSGLEALQRGDGPRALHFFSSFNFGKRMVEEYRLYFLANSYQLTGDRQASRRTLR